MMRGAKILLLGGSFAVASCGTDQVQVRAIPQPGAKFRYSGDPISQGRAQLAFNSVGLALESFRKAQREQPGADAYAGLAACYAAMGRFDLARANYEFALAYAPTDPQLLTALASSLDRLGENEQAAQVRAEAARVAAVPASQPRPQQVATAMGVPGGSSVTVKLPAATVTAAAAAPRKQAAIEIAPPKLTAAKVQLAPARPAVIGKPVIVASTAFAAPADVASEKIWTPEVRIAPPKLEAARVALASPPVALNGGHVVHADAGISIPQAEPTRAVVPTVPIAQIAPPVFSAASVSLPAARPAKLKVTALTASVEIPTAAPEVVPAPAAAASTQTRASGKPLLELATTEARLESGPYLERRSPGEVSLITTGRPVRLAKMEPRTPLAKTVNATVPLPEERSPAPLRQTPQPLVATALRWVPLRFASAPQNVVLLNAARSEGLAARTRTALIDRGWRKIAIGNARRVRERTVVLYSSARAFAAQRLASRLGCKAVKMAGIRNMIVLLGRDSTSRRSATRQA